MIIPCTQTSVLEMRIFLTAIVLAGLPCIAFGDSIRCGSRIIERGSSSAELSAFCGDPTSVSKSSSYGGDGRPGRDGVITASSGDIEVETWTYNFGPNQLMERVRIENGMVVQIDSLGYGYNEP